MKREPKRDGRSFRLFEILDMIEEWRRKQRWFQATPKDAAAWLTGMAQLINVIWDLTESTMDFNAIVPWHKKTGIVTKLKATTRESTSWR